MSKYQPRIFINDPEKVVPANLIEQFFGKAERKIELFARQQIEGWECWGNETNKFNV